MISMYKKILSLLGPREKRRFGLVILMVLIMGLFEAGGLASVIPFLKVLSDPGIIERNDLLFRIYEAGGFQTSNGFLMALGAGMFGVIVVGTIVKMATMYAVTRFGQMRSYTLSYRLFRHYLGQDYIWFQTHHSAHLAKNILSEVDEVVNTAILPAVRTVSYFVIALAMTGVLFAADPVMAIAIAGVIGGFYLFIYMFSRGRLGRIGKEGVRANRERFYVVNETFGGIKHVKLHGLEGEFLHRFRAPAQQLARRRAARELIGELPRYVLEAVLLGGILVVILVKLSASNGDLGDVLPIIGLYAFAGIRMFPVMQHIYRGVSKMRFAHAALDTLYRNLRSLPGETAKSEASAASVERDVPAMGIRKEIELENITFQYTGSKRPTIKNLSLSIAANTTVAFIGSTGSGKTTLVDIILGLLRPDAGRLLVDGVVIDERTMSSWRKCVGYVPQSIFLTDDTVAGNIAFGVPADKIDMSSVERAARIARLHDFVVGELPNGYDTRVGENGIRLSGGQRQRIGIARALYYDPDMIVLDEATSALDNITERAVMEAVHNLTRSKTIILIAHRLSTVRQCEKIFLINHGQLVAQGKFEELLSNSESFRKMCGELTEQNERGVESF